MYLKIEERISALEDMKIYPPALYYSGNLELLYRKKVSIVGSRKPLKYTRNIVTKLATALSKLGVVIVSGGAMGVDALAHHGAKSANTIAVLPSGIDIKYPAVNKKLLNEIENEGLVLSQFEAGSKARPYTFVIRNEVVVALGDVLIVAEAELGSGSMRSIEFALAMGKKIYVLPHRLEESSATQQLLKDGHAEAIYDIEKFVSFFGDITDVTKDEFLEFCQMNPTYEEALQKFPDRVFEAELSGEVEVRNARVYLL